VTSTTLDWKTDEKLAVGKGATVQQFVASLGGVKLEIDVAPWGEGHLRINGREIAHVDGVKDRRQAFRAIKEIAERYVETHMLKSEKKNASIELPAVKAKLLEGKKGLIVGIANESSIAWGCAKAFRAFGAEVAVTYLNDKAKKFVEPLARALEAPIFMPLDVNTPGQMEAVFERIGKDWGKLDFVVHSHCLFAKGRASGPCGGCTARRLCHDDGCVVLDFHSHGAFGRTADAQGRNAVHDELLRQPDGR
jgi:enoyl-[acyl-carrier protein] reductase I